MSQKEKQITSSSPRPFFVNAKTKGQTPVLRKKAGEEEKKFFERMAKLGYENLEKVEKHWSQQDAMALHSGPADKCRVCRRSMPKAKPEAKSEGSVLPAVTKEAAIPSKPVEDKKADLPVTTPKAPEAAADKLTPSSVSSLPVKDEKPTKVKKEKAKK